MSETLSDSEEPQLPTTGTEAARAYFEASRADIVLFDFILRTVLSYDHAVDTAREGLAKIQTILASHNAGHITQEALAKIDPTSLARSNPGARFWYKNLQALLEMFLARAVDNFETYLVDLLRTVLRAKPEILSTRQQTLALEEILKYQRIEDLVHDVIERKVIALSYEGFVELQTWCRGRGIEIHVPANELAAVIALIATRNVIAHNRGTVDERYVRTVKHSRFMVGHKRELEVNDLFLGRWLFHRIVADTDAAVGRKFALPMVSFPPRTSTEDSNEREKSLGRQEEEASGTADAEPRVAGDVERPRAPERTP